MTCNCPMDRCMHRTDCRNATMSKPKTIRTVDAKLDRLRARLSRVRPADPDLSYVVDVLKGMLDLLDEELV